MAQRIEKKCFDTNNLKLNLGYYNRARDAFKSVIKKIKLKKGDKILLPAYIGWSPNEGSGVFDPVSETKLDPVFYKFDKSLKIDVDDISEKILNSGAEAILIIHYFGFIDPNLKMIIKKAKKAGLVVIEDAAHALFTDFVGGVCGRYGDYTIYSLHKMLPFESGGMLLANNDSILPTDAEQNSIFGNPFHFDFKSVAKKRIENYKLISTFIGKGDKYIKPSYVNLPKGVIPQTYPVILPISNRDEVYKDMNEKGWGVVSLYHTMIGEIESGDFKNSKYLSRHLINLPVHQDCDTDLFVKMISDFKAIVKKHKIN